MTEIITIGGQAYRMRASALVPRLYRAKTGRDAVADMSKLEQSLRSIQKDKKAGFEQLDLEIFESIAWAMCYAADKENTPDSIEEWLDGIEGIFSIYEALPKIFELWNKGQETTAQPAKK